MDENVGSGLEHGAKRGAVPGDCNIGESKGENGVLLRELLNDANALTASCSDVSLLSVLLYCQLQVFKEMISSQIQHSLLLSKSNKTVYAVHNSYTNMHTLSIISIHTLDDDPVLVVKHFITLAAVNYHPSPDYLRDTPQSIQLIQLVSSEADCRV